MNTRSRKRLVCFHCSVPLGTDDRHHYGYQCHDCVVREHELILLQGRDPDHPDVAWLESSPVHLELPARADRPSTGAEASEPTGR